jgi:hypothetical protein
MDVAAAIRLMETRDLIERLVPEVTRNATVVRVDERDGVYRVTIAGTTGVESRCEIASETVVAALDREDAHARLVTVLKACADRTVVEVPDARG